MYNKNVQTDNELIQRYVNGDENALAFLLEKHKRKVFAFINMRVKNRTISEDIFQDTFFKVIDCLRNGKYKDEGKFSAWMMMIAHNLCMDHFRKQKRQPNVVNSDGSFLFDKLSFSNESKEDEIIKQQTILRVKDMINLLPDDQKEVVILRHYAEMSFKEIAEMTGTNMNTALGRMRYALLNLRKMMTNKVVV
ncbi:MAG TPA: sigma-70 family RNA polymerase sigma factor [Chitinophagales bacterium]|nr:sigma-70 family RNA polymerase sigma factor [Chitinophagales bacterium]